jgi:hypothetical protein
VSPLVLLGVEDSSDKDESDELELSDRLPVDGTLSRRYNVLSFEMRRCFQCSYSRRSIVYSRTSVFARALRWGGLGMTVLDKHDKRCSITSNTH